MTSHDLVTLLADVRQCRLCEAHLPLGPRPVLRASATARILIVGQAPGTRVHETGIPWNDRSGDQLREWMGVSKNDFYDESRIAIVPMGFCYPGVLPKGGDKPPRPECAPAWHDKVLSFMPEIELVLVIGMYAQKRYLGTACKKTLTETVAAWREFGPKFLPLPHPSWRNNQWQKKHPWFGGSVLPYLRDSVSELL